jgi:hypothetical protein
MIYILFKLTASAKEAAAFEGAPLLAGRGGALGAPGLEGTTGLLIVLGLVGTTGLGPGAGGARRAAGTGVGEAACCLRASSSAFHAGTAGLAAGAWVGMEGMEGGGLLAGGAGGGGVGRGATYASR